MGNCGSSPQFDDIPQDKGTLLRQVQELQFQLQQRDQYIATFQAQKPGSQLYPTVPAPVAGAAYGAPTNTEVLFFPDPAMPCKYGGQCRRGAGCKFAHTATSLLRLLHVLGEARGSIDVCVFTITCNEIADALLSAHRRGVAVRIVTDDDQMATTGSDVASLKAAGIAVRHDSDRAHMHHKFAIIDRRLVINGSFNWTRAAVLANQENIVITDMPLLASAFQQKFEQLWAKYRSTA